MRRPRPIPTTLVVGAAWRGTKWTLNGVAQEEREGIVMNGLIKWLIVAALGLYVLSPVDLAPGPIDDAIMVLIYFVAARRKRLASVVDEPDIVGPSDGL